MKKKLLAFLTALACMASTAGMTASAEYIRTKGGGIGYDYRSEMFKGFLVETDGTELTEDMLLGVSGFSQLIPLEFYVYDAPWGHSEISYQPEGTAYMVSIDSDDPETLTKLGRSFMLSNDCITQVRLVNFEKYGSAVATSCIIIYPQDLAVKINDKVISELEDFVFESASKGYKFRHNHTEDCNCDLCSDLREIPSGGYDYYQRMQAFADGITEKYSDLVASAKAEVLGLEASDTTTSSDISVWDGAGDCNADGLVNAQDAAEQLIAAANAGTGSEIEITSANDVNADGAVNALDAAAVLIYAAAKGSGEAVSWVEVLK